MGNLSQGRNLGEIFKNIRNSNKFPNWETYFVPSGLIPEILGNLFFREYFRSGILGKFLNIPAILINFQIGKLISYPADWFPKFIGIHFSGNISRVGNFRMICKNLINAEVKSIFTLGKLLHSRVNFPEYSRNLFFYFLEIFLFTA